jgi:hypothetical protein
MTQDDEITCLMADVKGLQLKVAALEAIILKNPEAKREYEALLEEAEKQLLREQSNESFEATLFAHKKPN